MYYKSKLKRNYSYILRCICVNISASKKYLYLYDSYYKYTYFVFVINTQSVTSFRYLKFESCTNLLTKLRVVLINLIGTRLEFIKSTKKLIMIEWSMHINWNILMVHFVIWSILVSSFIQNIRADLGATCIDRKTKLRNSMMLN